MLDEKGSSGLHFAMWKDTPQPKYKDMPNQWKNMTKIAHNKENGQTHTVYQGRNMYIIKVEQPQNQNEYYFQITDKDYATQHTSDSKEFWKRDLRTIFYYHPPLLLVRQSYRYYCVYIKYENLQAKHDRLINLPKQAAEAIIAFKIIQYIREVKISTFYQNQTTSIGQRIFRELQNNFGLPFKHEKFCQFLKKLFSQSVPYDQNIFDQRRFHEAETDFSQLTFFPTFTTKQMFDLILHMISIKSSIIYGASGIGKSFSFCLFCNLFQEIEKYLANNSLKQIQEFIDVDVAQMPKVFYFTIQQKTSVTNFEDLIIQQVKLNVSKQQLRSLKTQRIQRFLREITNIYLKKIGRPPVILVDQINLYYSFLRKGECVKQIQEILYNIHHRSDFKVIYSSSLTEQEFYHIWTDTSIKLEFQNYSGIDWWSLDNNRLPEIYEFLNFINFQTRRVFKRTNPHVQSTSFIESFGHMKFIKENREKQILQYAFPINLLQTRQFLSKQPHNRKFYHQNHSGLEQYYNNTIIRIQNLIKYHFQQVRKSLSQFLQKGSAQYISWKIFVTLKIIQMIRNEQCEHFDQGLTLSVKHLFQSQKDDEKQKRKKRQAFESAIETNIFQFSKGWSTLTIYKRNLQPTELLQSAIFHSIHRASSYIDIIFNEIFQDNGTVIGQFLDKSFARAVSQGNLCIKIRSQSIYLRLQKTKKIQENQNLNRTKFQEQKFAFFVNFSGKLFNIPQQKLAKCLPPNYKQINQSIQQSKLNGKEEANKFIKLHLGQLIHKLDNYQFNQWIGAAPKTRIAKKSKLNVISSNSPSFDFLLMRKIKEQNYEILTFDLSIGEFSQNTLKERLQRASRISMIIKQIFSFADKQIDLFHVLLASRKAKQIYQKIKGKEKYFASKFKGINLQMVEDLQNVTAYQLKQTGMTYLTSALKIAKQYISNQKI